MGRQIQLRTRLLLLVLCVGFAGCRSRFVEVTIVNQGPTVHVMEFDYPSASFGANSLATGTQYRYRMKTGRERPIARQVPRWTWGIRGHFWSTLMRMAQ